MVSHLVAPGNLCLSLPGSHDTLAARFSGITSHCRMRLLGRLAILCHQLHGDVTETKRGTILPVGDSQYPHSMAYRQSMGSGTSSKPLSDSPLGYILRNWKILTLQKAWPLYKLGDQPLQKNKTKLASEWHTSFCQKQGKALCSVFRGPQSESGFEGLMSHVFLLPPYLLSPSVSLHQISQMTLTRPFISI